MALIFKKRSSMDYNVLNDHQNIDVSEGSVSAPLLFLNYISALFRLMYAASGVLAILTSMSKRCCRKIFEVNMTFLY